MGIKSSPSLSDNYNQYRLEPLYRSCSGCRTVIVEKRIQPVYSRCPKGRVRSQVNQKAKIVFSLSIRDAANGIKQDGMTGGVMGIELGGMRKDGLEYLLCRQFLSLKTTIQYAGYPSPSKDQDSERAVDDYRKEEQRMNWIYSLCPRFSFILRDRRYGFKASYLNITHLLFEK